MRESLRARSRERKGEIRRGEAEVSDEKTPGHTIERGRDR